ncbi:hypothetical protein CF328_g6938 [Tilletia controversa]|nr:hypothetical protein CF328_g6938 [Tilletia controversa]
MPATPPSFVDGVCAEHDRGTGRGLPLLCLQSHQELGNSNRRPALPPTTDHQDYAFASGLRRDLPNIVTERTAQVASGAGARSWSSRVALSLGASLPSPFFPVDQTADQIRYRPLPTWPSLSHSRRPKL